MQVPQAMRTTAVQLEESALRLRVLGQGAGDCRFSGAPRRSQDGHDTAA